MQQQDLSRVIIHIDFDSYYTQVEMKRLGIPRELPCAVQQWEGLIAVNYPARERGISRHMRVKEAKKVCPELVLVHVETLGGGSNNSGGGSGTAEGREAGGDAAAGTGGGGNAAAGTAAGGPSGAAGGGNAAGYGDGQETNRLTQKACLERYRRSTVECLVLLHRLAPAAVIEKASIDEVYMDVTAMVDGELQGKAGPSAVDAFSWNSLVIGAPLDVSSEFERRLAVGAGIACRLRGALLRDMSYTASAGIAANKLLAKIGSAMHKPNQQTVIPPRSAQQVMQDLPLKKLGGFGGKLGEQLAAIGCTTAGQVQQLPQAALVGHFGAERATWIEQAVRGMSNDPVQERERPKSMLAAKSFNPTSDPAALHSWFRVLAQELAGRMAADEAQFRRRPKNLVVHYRGGPQQAAAERSKSCAMPRGGGGTTASPDAITACAFALFKSKCTSEALPCSRLAISAADFTDLPAANGTALTRFLVPKATTAAGGGGAAAAAGDSGGGSVSIAARGEGAGDVGTAAAEGAAGADRQQPPGAQEAANQQQQQQQRQALQQHARQPRAPAAGPSISSMFERAQQRQRLDPPPQQEQQQRGQQHARQQSATAARPSISSMFERAQQRQRLAPQQQHDQEQQQEREQQQQHVEGGASSAGPSISSMFDRAQKRQRLDQQQQQEQQQQPPAPSWPVAAFSVSSAAEKAGRQDGFAQQQAQRQEQERQQAQERQQQEQQQQQQGAQPTDGTNGSDSPGAAGAADSGAAGIPEAAAAAAGQPATADLPAACAPNEATAAAAPNAATAAPPPAGAAEELAAAGPAAGSAAAGPAGPAAAGPAADELLAEVDLQEQRQILKDIHMLQMLARNKTSAGGEGQPGAGGSSSRQAARPASKRRQEEHQQRGISSFFGKQPNGGS